MGLKLDENYTYLRPERAIKILKILKNGQKERIWQNLCQSEILDLYTGA